jgi:membrane protease subunit HflC
MKSLKHLITAIAIVFIAVIGLSISTYSVKPNYSAAVIRFGKIVRVTETEGLKFKIPFIESVVKVYSGDNLYDIPSSDVITSDKKSMIADNYVVWSVTDAISYYQTLGAVQARAEERIEAAVYNATKNIVSSMTQDEILAARGSTLTDMITKESNSDITQYGVKIDIAEIKALDLPDDNKESVYERMISERNNIAASYTAQGEAEAAKVKNETDRQVTVITAAAEKEAAILEAEGEAEYMKILADAYNDEDKAAFYNFIIGLDALDAFTGDNKTLILNSDSEYAQLLMGVE